MAIITRITEKGIVQEYQEDAPAALKIEVTATDSSGATITGGGGGGGGGDVNAQYLTLATSTTLNNERVFSPQPGLKGTDSGAGLSYRLSIDNSVVATISGSTFTGATKHNLGLSGSLTQLIDGTSYLIAGSNIAITSASNGSVTVATKDGISGSLTNLTDGTSYLVAGPNISIVSQSNGSILITASVGTTPPGGSSNHVQYNFGGAFTGDANFTFVTSGATADSTLRLSGSFEQGNGAITRGNTGTAFGSSTAGARWFVADASGITNGVIVLDNLLQPGDCTASFTSGSFISIKEANWWNGGLDEITGVSYNAGTNSTTITTTSTRTSAPGVTVFAYDILKPNEINAVEPTSNSYADGNSTSLGNSSHAEGESTALGPSSHAEGSGKAIAAYSHAEGNLTEALGDQSHAAGLATVASGSNQYAVGKYNKRGNDFSLFVIGNGTDDPDADRSDILRVNTDSVQVSGSLIVSGAYIHNVVSGTTAPTYEVGSWDHVIVFTDNVVTATLPTLAPIGRKIIFKDGTGAASTGGGQMISCSLGIIDGSATYTMASVNYTAVSVIKINDPDEWIVV